MIDVPEGQQECRKFGMHNRLRRLHQMYLDKDLLWVSNVGNMLGGDGFKIPPAVGNHIVQQRQMEKGWVHARNDTGVLGRLSDVLVDLGYRTRKFTTDGWGPTLSGDSDRSGGTARVSSGGFTSMSDFNLELYDQVTKPGSSAYSHYYRSQIDVGLSNHKLIDGVLKNAQLGTNFDGEFASQLGVIATLIQGHEELEMERAFFTMEVGGFDSHSGQEGRLNGKLENLDKGVSEFVDEMKRIGQFENVAVVMRSEFGRTHRGNRNSGTDHGWNGNYFVLGGSVKGGQVLGQYPVLGQQGPKHSWEAVYKPIFEWAGVEPHQWDEVLPNHANFDNLFSMADFMEV